MSTMAQEKFKQRLADVNFAVGNGMGYSDLADVWAVSTPAAWAWAHKRLPPETCAKLAENGKLQVQSPRKAPNDRAPWSVHDRLELVSLTRANRWPDSKLARQHLGGSICGMDRHDMVFARTIDIDRQGQVIP